MTDHRGDQRGRRVPLLKWPVQACGAGGAQHRLVCWIARREASCRCLGCGGCGRVVVWLPDGRDPSTSPASSLRSGWPGMSQARYARD